jgi:carboxymethylenebutenolidase
MVDQEISFPVEGRTLRAVVARPEGAGPFPAVVVIHEAFGLTDHIRDVTRRFACAGYVAMAVDLFTGRNRALCMARFAIGMLTDSLEHGAIRDLEEALTHLAVQPGVDPARLGAIGFCMGGGFAIAWACSDPRLKVIAPFYGPAPRPLEAATRLCPLVGSYPAGDITTPSARRLDALLDRHGIPHDIVVYDGARHSFFDDRKPARHHAAAAADAWRRTLEFFATHIARPRPAAPVPRSAGVIAPPPLLHLAAFGVGLAVQWLLGISVAVPQLVRIAAAAVIVAGSLVVAWAFATLRRAGTTPNPNGATSVLVSEGPFRFSRNPVYVAMLAMYLGAAAITGWPGPLITIAPLVWVMSWGVVRREERYLAWRFGDAYRRYRAKVRRWL